VTTPAAGAHQSTRPVSGTELVRQAEVLADELRAAPSPVQRNIFLSLVAGFLGDGDVGRMRRLLEVLRDERSVSAAHFERSGSWGDQARHARGVLARLLATAETDSRHLQTLFGWTARILEIRAKFGDRRPSGPASGRGGSGGPRRRRAGDASSVEPKPRPAGRLGLGGRSLDALERLRRRIENGDDDPGGGS